MVLKGEVWNWREVPHNSVSELILKNIFSNDHDISIYKGLIQSAPDTKLGITINEDQVILSKELEKEKKKKQESFLLGKTKKFLLVSFRRMKPEREKGEEQG